KPTDSKGREAFRFLLRSRPTRIGAKIELNHEGVSSSHCRRAVSRTLTQLSGGVRKFTCSSVLSLECP
ncbi:unnamed protein product, partial [Effrenium voratum]